MSLAGNRSGIDGDDDEIADIRELGLEVGATESHVNLEFFTEIGDNDTMGSLEIDDGSNDDPSTNGSSHYLGQDFSIKSDTGELRKESSRGNERHEIIETRILDDSVGHNVNYDSDVGVDEQDDEFSGVEHEESEEEESSDDCNSHYSDILSRSEINNPWFVRWPIEDLQIAEESMESKNEIKTAIAETLNPNLCIFCRVFFDTWSSVCNLFLESHPYHSLVSAHHDTMSGLEASASSGCDLCALFLSILHITHFRAHESGNNLLLDELKPYRIKLWNKGLRRDDLSEGWCVSLNFWSIKDGIRSKKTADAKMIPVNLSDSRHWIRQFHIDTNLGQKNLDKLRLGCTEESAALAQAWLQECFSSHSACGQGEEASVLPTRLIKINCQEIRLCLSADENCSQYATLSHCWGKAEVLRLQKDNYEDFLKKIPYEKLCKTFRDAINIGRFLGFSWLWIDSLCIIQGDSEDWSKEASRMATVYGLSSLNIAATAASDGTIGCLFERNLKYTEKARLEVKMNHQRRVYRIEDMHLYDNNIARAPLAKRAWAVQERILAPRTLHFTRSQLFWECRTNQACESHPDTLPQYLYKDQLYLPTQELQSWSKIIEIYTWGSLTKESDRLIAIGGVARQYQKKNGDKYFAGLWQSRIREQMCWYNSGGRGHHSGENTWRAPSWSWAAVNQGVFLPWDTNMIHEAYVDVIKVEIALENVDDPFGGVKSGVLTLRSKTMILCEKNNEFSDISVDKISIRWDREDCGLESYRKPILILPIGVSEDQFTRIEGLLLTHTNQENGQYERIGHFGVWNYCIEYELIRRAVNLAQDEQFEELGLLKNGGALPSEKDYISTDMDEDGITWYTISII